MQLRECRYVNHLSCYKHQISSHLRLRISGVTVSAPVSIPSVKLFIRVSLIYRRRQSTWYTPNKKSIMFKFGFIRGHAISPFQSIRLFGNTAFKEVRTWLLKFKKTPCCHIYSHCHIVFVTRPVKDKAIPVTGRGGSYTVKTSTRGHFLGSRLKDGGKVVSLTHRPPFTPRKIPGTHFC
jgi:hypothetical protein